MLLINDLTYRLGPRLLFDKASAALPDGARVGLVGRNGVGKTTLFRIIAGEIGPETGSVLRPKGARLGRVEQEAPGGPQTLIDFVLQADLERSALLGESDVASEPHRVAEIQTRLADIGAHAAPARAAAILAGLGFDHAAQGRALSEFSGGWRMRVALASVLFAAPDLLLLDEPTNYLDLEGTLWLVEYLGRYPATIIVISHDRDLLDAVADHVLHLDQGKLSLYRGNYTSFAQQRAEQQTIQLKLRRKQDDHRRHLQAFVDRFKAKASKARQAQSRVKMLAKMETVDLIVDANVLPFHFPSPARRLSPPIVSMEAVSTGYGGQPVLARLNLFLSDDDRIGLLGSNGNGKSTLAKLIAGRLAPTSGRIVRAAKLNVGFFAQHQVDDLTPSGTPYSHVAALMPGSAEARIRARAAQMGFTGGRADTVIAQLSGGEKARLVLGLATFSGPHLLIMDEPTNHLDIDSRSALIEAINDYEGAVILISHDKYLVEACADQLWLVADGTCTPFDGDIEDYKGLVLHGLGDGADDKRTKRGKQRVTAAAAASKDSRHHEAAKPRDLGPLRKKLWAVEEKIDRFGQLLARLDAVLASTDAFTREPTKAADLSRQRADLQRVLKAAEEEWLALSTMMERASPEG